MTRIHIADWLIAIFLGLIIVILLLPPVHADPIALDGATIETAFAPGDGPSRLVATAIDEAEHQVRVMTYQLTNGRVINALRAAASRGVDVAVIIDEATCNTTRLAAVFPVLHRAGIETSCDGKHPIHHNKVVIIDNKTVVTGSFNFSPSAERNAENTNVIRAVPAVAAIYLAVWQEHRAHSEARSK